MADQQDPAAAVRSQALAWLEEAGRLRQQVKDNWPPPHSSPPAYAEFLLQVRAVQDRVEELVGSVLSLRHMSRRWARDHEAGADDAWAARSAQDRRSGRVAEFSSARERAADTDLAVLPQLQRARAAAKFNDEMEEIYSRMQVLYRGLDATRQDLGSYLRAQIWEAAMER
jgi:hypothetical protein